MPSPHSKHPRRSHSERPIAAPRESWRCDLRWDRAFAAAFLIAIVAVVGCTPAAEAPLARARRIPEAAPFLLAPTQGYELGLAPADRAAVEEAHRGLIQASLVEEALQVSARLLQGNSNLAPAIVLEAQALIVEDRPEEARERLRPVVRQLPYYDAALLAYGRAAETTGASVEAIEAYGNLQSRSQLAARRFRELLPGVVKIQESAVVGALERGRIDLAKEELRILKRWASEDIATLRATAEVAAAEGDSVSELQALRGLSSKASLGRELDLRRAHLELEVGDAGAGLRVVQDLAEAAPDDARLAAELARAQFVWRLGLLPGKVRQVASLPEMERADLAVLLYWLFPSVRYGQTDTGRIANDVLDHPHRQEIVRVANLEIMSIDPRLHRFFPDRKLTREGSMSPILKVLSRHRPRPACLDRAGLATRLGSTSVCDLAKRCGLIELDEACLPDAPASGATSLEWMRRALDRLASE